MSHNKRFRSAIAVVLILLLTAAIAPTASAQTGDDGDAAPAVPPPPPDPPVEVDPPDPDPPAPGPTAPTDPVDPPPPPANGATDEDDDDDTPSMPSPHSWPPPNAIVRHAATPVQISALPGGLNVYFIGPDGSGSTGPVIPAISELAEMHAMGAAVSLYSGMNPGTGKAVEIVYLPDEMKIRVSTFYADKPPHDYNKPYVFTVDADHSVTHDQW